MPRSTTTTPPPPPPDPNSTGPDPVQLTEEILPAVTTTTDNPAATLATKALNGKKLSLEARNASLRVQIKEARAKRDEVKSQLRNPDPATTVKRHIKFLHDYNEIRDIGTGLMGMIADSRGLRVKDVYTEFGVDVKD
ncbi:MAG: hypothetical protein M1840_006278 [Geoglossum simile]|nr:MAG: hypothetical protein M1840_006278 [Geoglossum simile]